MDSQREAGSQEKYEARLRRRWPLLEMQDLADIALGQATLLECLELRYRKGRKILEAEIAEFDNATPPPDLI
jgi:hypothetical protein